MSTAKHLSPPLRSASWFAAKLIPLYFDYYISKYVISETWVQVHREEKYSTSD